VTTSRPVMRRAAAWTVALGLLWAAIAGLLWDQAMALGVVAGAAIGGLNFWLLGRALGQMMADPEQFRNAKRKIPRPLMLKWPLIFALLAIAVWWLPVRPEGIAMGALISLVSLTIAGLRERSAGEPDPPAPEP
jgi:membrane protein YqaA with SNARE-associated domain